MGNSVIQTTAYLSLVGGQQHRVIIHIPWNMSLGLSLLECSAWSCDVYPSNAVSELKFQNSRVNGQPVPRTKNWKVEKNKKKHKCKNVKRRKKGKKLVITLQTVQGRWQQTRGMLCFIVAESLMICFFS